MPRASRGDPRWQLKRGAEELIDATGLSDGVSRFGSSSFRDRRGSHVSPPWAKPVASSVSWFNVRLLAINVNLRGASSWRQERI
jgi:hypothetical protein